jgi:hypothetical protein
MPVPIDDLTKLVFWQQQWAAFTSAIWIMLPLFIIVVFVVWWLSGKLSEAQIAGLKEQIAAKEDRLKLAADGLDRAKDDLANLDKQFQAYKAEVAAKGKNASPEKVDAAIEQLKREDAIMEAGLSVAARLKNEMEMERIRQGKLGMPLPRSRMPPPRSN